MFNNPEVHIQNIKTQKGRPSRKRSKGSWLSALCRFQEAISFKPGDQWPEGVLLAIVEMFRG